MIVYCDEIDVTDFTFIIPSVSVGNVGQLAVDLLINSLNLKRLCYVWHEGVVPVVGADPFGHAMTMTTGCEIFYSTELNILVMQIRSGIIRTYNDFSQFVCAWAKERCIKQIIILTGSAAHERRDRQLVGKQVRYIFCPLTIPGEADNANAREWIEYEVHSEKRMASNEISYIPGGGITICLFKTCMLNKLPCSILIKFCSDGNNAPDAYILADYLDEWLNIKENSNITEWSSPHSWIFLYGPLPPAEIFN